MWRENHTNDYKFMDRRISEEFTVGGTGVLLHKYLGTINQANTYPTSANVTANTSVISFANVALFEPGQNISGAGIQANTVIFTTNTTVNTITISKPVTETISTGTAINVYWRDPTQPIYNNQSATNIQDLLWLENRDRKYDKDVYKMRGIYTVNDNDFDLQQFGIFLSADTVYMTFHLNDTVRMIGRKLMSGDVLELQHKKDYYPLDEAIPISLKRYYVIQDVTFASEGFSQTWWPHLIRIKMSPLVDSQEYKDILNQITVGDNDTPIGQIISNYNKLNEINDAIIMQAENLVPKSGTDIDNLYVEPLLPDGSPGDPTGQTVDLTTLRVNSTFDFASTQATTPDTNIPAYLGGDGNAPNGWPVVAGTSFPANPNIGDYALRLDYIPNRLFRWNGARWIKIEDNVRTDLTPGPNNQTQRSIFVNNTDTFVNNEGQTVAVRQSLSKALTPRADN
jgi:hypothetical protein